MAVKIRLKRVGKNPKKRPYFRVAVFEETRNRDGRAIEELGFYDPLKGDVKIKKERFNYWLSKGAQPTETLKSLIKKSK